MCVVRFHGAPNSRTTWADEPAAPAEQRNFARSRRRKAGAGVIHVGAAAQQVARALGGELLEVVEQRPVAARAEPGGEPVVVVVGGDVLRRVDRRGEGEGATSAVGERSWTMPRRPCSQAEHCGVKPMLVAWSTSAFAARSIATISVWPRAGDAQGVWPPFLGWSTLAFAASSFATTPVWPFMQAM